MGREAIKSGKKSETKGKKLQQKDLSLAHPSRKEGGKIVLGGRFDEKLEKRGQGTAGGQGKESPHIRFVPMNYF